MDCMRSQLNDGCVLDGRYETLSPLNHGSFGMVFMARDLLTGKRVALKCLTKSSSPYGTQFSDLSVDDQSEERTLHLRIGSHPNIVDLLHSFETKNHAYLVLEFCPNGDLYEAIRFGKGPLETEHVRDFMLQLVSAVEHLHSRGIYHRDIKPENIFLSSSGSMKLGDFGLATTDKWSFESAVGSDRYMAPEQYDPGYNGYSPAQADVWAIGICLLNVLFSRNPFATPSLSDPLFADFAGDRQTLFDVFPTMSQDTYEVLVHCLALDPNKRSLAGVREAIERAVSFTTDDEALDEFCIDGRGHVKTSANREPLRTPSVTSPQLDQGGSFPWAKALAMTPQQAVRQLSVIPDMEPYVEDLFSGSARSSQDWFSVKPDTASTSSFVDSGLGVSFASTLDRVQPDPTKSTRSKPVPISGSLPVNVARGAGSLSTWGEKRDMVSKSWSDLWDEDEEDLSMSETENVDVAFPTAAVKVLSHEKNWKESESGLSTPRAGLVEMKNPATVHNSRNRSPPTTSQTTSDVPAVDELSEHTGFIFESCDANVPRYSPPPKRTAFDRWAALGDRRRANPEPASSTPQKPTLRPQPSPNPHKRSRAASWRRHLGWSTSQSNEAPASGPVPTSTIDNNNTTIHNNQQNNNHGVWERKEWSLSRDWRQHADPVFVQPSAVRRSVDDIGDLEWVGGWNDLHL